jgi:hypothetical protein
LISDQRVLQFSIDEDADSDGFGDRLDKDDDNDGYADETDAFPTDPTEWADFDGDGIGDNADPDDDNDNVDDSSDVYPYNSACATAVEGDGTQCYVHTVFQDYSRIFDGNGQLYFYRQGENLLVRWDVSSAGFVEKIQLGQSVTPGAALQAIAVSLSQNRLYIGYDNGEITYVDTTLAFQEQAFVNLGGELRALRDAGDYLMATQPQGSNPFKSQFTIIDSLGTTTGTTNGESMGIVYLDYRNNKTPYDTYYLADAVNGIYYDDFDNADLDLSSGAIIADQANWALAPLATSPDGLHSVRQDGNVYINATRALSPGTSTLPVVRPGAFIWNNAGLSYINGHEYVRINEGGTILDDQTLPVDAAQSIYDYNGKLLIVGTFTPAQSTQTELRVLEISP